MTTMNNLIQILLPTNGGDDGVFERAAVCFQRLNARRGARNPRITRALRGSGLRPSSSGTGLVLRQAEMIWNEHTEDYAVIADDVVAKHKLEAVRCG